MKFDYSCYNLKVTSELELPELGTGLGSDISADIIVEFRDLSDSNLSDSTQIAPFVWSKNNTLIFEVPGVARFLITGGSSIAIDPAPTSDEASLRVFLLGSAFGALLMQRGFFVLHGNAIEIDGQCLICVGPSGIGKSTLTAAFLRRGYRVLADDVVPIDANGFAIPGFPRIKLWQDAADKMEINTEVLSRIRPNLEKFNMPLGVQFCAMPRPVTHICLLSEHHGETVEITQVKGFEKFPVLQANTYRPRFTAGMQLKAEHLRQCGALADKVSISKVQRPKVGFKLDELVDALLSAVRQEA